MESPVTPPFILNQSRLKDFNNCNRYYAWKYLQNLDTLSRPAAPEIGIAVHAALASLHAGRPLVECIKEARASLEKRSGPTTAFANMELSQASATTENLLRSYVAHWTHSDQMWTPLAQELEFLTEIIPGWWTRTFGAVSEADGVQEICFTCDGTKPDCKDCPDRVSAAPPPPPLPSTGIFLRGRGDNLSTVLNALYLVDYKTASRLDPRDMAKYELDLQLSAYIYGLSKQLTEEARAIDPKSSPIRIEGAIIDLLAKTATPQFTRESYARTDEELEEFASEFVEYATRIRTAHERVDAGEAWKTVFPKDTEACFKWGRACVFRDLCLNDTRERRMAFGTRQPDYVDAARAEAAKTKVIPTTGTDRTKPRKTLARTK